jgi:hypothetical protein
MAAPEFKRLSERGREGWWLGEKKIVSESDSDKER